MIAELDAGLIPPATEEYLGRIENLCDALEELQ